MINKKQLQSGLEYIEISNMYANASIALQGAHVFRYQRNDSEPLLWLSPESYLEPGKAIRGGVPICWPWFGQHPSNRRLPQHGFARTSRWKIAGMNETADEKSEITMRLKDSRESLETWPFRFELLLRIGISQTLEISMVTINLDNRPFQVSAALHTYFNVSDINTTTIKGLEGLRYLDKTTGDTGIQAGTLHIDRETDKIFTDAGYPLEIDDGTQRVKIAAAGSSSAVVWNPWREKCAVMDDMPDDGWKTMVCVEVANVLQDAREIRPGESHELAATIY